MQRSLLDLLPAEDSIAGRFSVWLEANGHVAELFRQFAEEVRAKGYRRYSADAIVQRIRWHLNVEVERTDGTEFLINDHYSSRLARWLVADDESFDGFFEFRKLTTE